MENILLNHIELGNNMQRIIYDIGANNGDDIPYYLMKCDKVVAVEANPDLTKDITQRFASEIDQGRLVVESCVITDEPNLGEVDFYVYVQPHLHVMNQFLPPPPDKLIHYNKIKLPSKSLYSIFSEHGYPYYVKLDVNENYEVQLLKKMFSCGIRPKYISSEMHTMDVFLTLIREGRYNTFSIVNGSTVSEVYNDTKVNVYNKDITAQYSFPHHSAGPFGDDIKSKWMNMIDLFEFIVSNGTGWIDIHATTI